MNDQNCPYPANEASASLGTCSASAALPSADSLPPSETFHACCNKWYREL